MLLEAYKYLSTPCARYVRRMGYLSELIATEARYRRCRIHWQPHLDMTCTMIERAVDASDTHRKVVVLGAGIVSDIPVDVLSRKFERVELIDVAFLAGTKRKLSGYQNVSFREADISGIAKALFETNQLPEPAYPPDLIADDIDLVISANVLSQLPLIPISYARKRAPNLREDDLKSFARKIIEQHLALLASVNAMRCLITETERLYTRDTEIHDTEDPLFGVTLEREGDEWLWDMAPRPEASRDFDIRNRVRGAYWR